jgi:glycosyltransferase involved in cell wall biosynthesis
MRSASSPDANPVSVSAAPQTMPPASGYGLLEPALLPHRRVRVLFINDTARNGGPGRSLLYILKFLDPAVVHRVVVLPRPGVIGDLYASQGVTDDLFYEPNLVENPVEPWDRPMARADFDAPLTLRSARFVGNVARAGFGLGRLARTIRRERYDLLYCNGTNANFAGGALAQATRVPALWHVRYTHIPPLVRPVHDALARSRGVRRILCVSRAAASLFPGLNDKVRVLHNALDALEFSVAGVTPRLRAELGLPADAIVFGSQGRILPRKGYVEMVQAAKIAIDELAPAEREKVHFAILGDTPEDIRPDHLAECRALVHRLGLERRVTFLGFKVDVKPYVADFDVAVVPSVYPDPLPRAVLEGMAFGKPVIAFDVGGVGEMLSDGETGELVRGSPPDVEGLARAFVRYARDPELRVRQGAAARLRIEKDFDSRAQARKIQNEIVRVVAARGSSHGGAP